ncbi:Glycosyl transferase family 2 [Roseateles sp. YR242]|uniref:glycosyltransferase n=1 Tax=Roseateles sp. YR242 TaxID=1855305 RepID=UPI0008D4D7EA|nr:glycosyltransferase [Roseateles sp. YR242]SEL21130.1 Glycosyl transferase family 2 [Roseateles sp. YR242]
MMGVVVPAHDEEALIGRCLEALAAAIAHPGLAGEQVQVLVVLDSCSDRTAEIAALHGVQTLAVDCRNVGMSRAAGARLMIERGVTWLSFTDADSTVAPCWLFHQAAFWRGRSADAVCGVVTVDDWQDFSAGGRQHYEALYADEDGHAHVHGASLGISSDAYLRAGGFAPLACHEDADLVQRLAALGGRVARTNAVRVSTSARRVGRVVGGFASYLDQLSRCATAAMAVVPNGHGL